MRYILGLALLLEYFTATAQEAIPSELFNSKHWALADHHIAEYVDTLNLWREGETIPVFLKDPMFDWRKLWLRGGSKVEIFSLRKVLLDRAFNKKLLEEIVSAPDSSLDEIYDPKAELSKPRPESMHMPTFPDIPFMELTTRQLALRRLKELDRGCSYRVRINYKTGCWLPIDWRINVMADSLNCFLSNSKLPTYLFDADLDFKYMEITKPCYEEREKALISMRKAILDRVYNLAALRAIIECGDSSLDALYTSNAVDVYNSTGASRPRIPYMKYSTRELAKRRLEKLNSKLK